MNQRGFTLLELMIALVLTALVMTLLYSGLRLALGSWQRVESQVQRQQDHYLIDRFLRQRLQQSVSGFWQVDGQRRLAFDGDGQRVRFVAPLMAWLGQGGLYTMELSRQQQALQLRWWPYRPYEQQPFKPRDRQLVQRVDHWQCAYYGAQDNQPAQWHDQWQGQNRRPQRLRCQWTVNGKSWPLLEVKLTP